MWLPGPRTAQGPGARAGTGSLTQQPAVQGHCSTSVLFSLKRGPSTWSITDGLHIGIFQKYFCDQKNKDITIKTTQHHYNLEALDHGGS